MLNPRLIESFFTAASIQRWNDYPRMVDLVELDKQAHKFIIAYLIASMEEGIDMVALIEAGIFEFLRRVVVTDIRPDVFRKILQKKRTEINAWVMTKLLDQLLDIDEGGFLERMQRYFEDESVSKKERFILKAASYLSTRWEFSIIYQTSRFLEEIDEVKKAVEEELEDYYELIGVRKIAMRQKLARFVDLSGRLRFQKRWAQTPRVPETSVLGHMLVVALFGYFYSLSIKACDSRKINNFYCALFHDLPEALTRDIITPVKYSVSGLNDIISAYEIDKIEEDILPLLPYDVRDYFAYLLGIYEEGKKDEFLNRIYRRGKVIVVDTLRPYNSDEDNAIDGVALKACDRLAAYVEATLSISHGVKSKELFRGRDEILAKLRENGKINGVDFYALAMAIEESLL